ncbi:helix-turn-helix transcriptional regulator [Oceanobacillus kapialis]|uniref:LuxR C-terminal-related transcriptional regulator n=1 Tax=Oceanobacillus kapialis TaxID=481353 RepID=A0ABW5PYX2_9BACI
MVKLLIVGPQSISTNKLYNRIPKDTGINVLGISDVEITIKNILVNNKTDIILIHHAEERLSLAEKVRDYSPKAKLMFLLTSNSRDAILFGLKLGGVSFILNEITPENLVYSLKNLHQDQYVLSGKLVRSFLADIPEDFFEKQLFKNKIAKQFTLSRRENEIAYLVYKNQKNIEISEVLHLKEKTVRDYVSKMYRKFGVRKRTELIRILAETMQTNNKY